MCGIAGYTGKQIPKKLQMMNQKMIHRGPDDEGFFEDDYAHLTMRRLSIIDLENGKQPQFNSDKTVIVFFNGEIYNYLELREELNKKGYKLKTASSDTEVIAYLYEEYGIDFIQKLIGMFAICLYDKNKNEIFLIRDRLGKKPIYYNYNDDKKTIEFASEFNTISLPDKNVNIDLNSLIWYFSQKTTPSSSSIDRRIRKIPPGHYLSIKKANPPGLFKYYSVGNTTVIKKDQNLIERELEALLIDSIKLRMRADVEVGAFLSGGVDSSLIVSIASKLTNKPLKTYCLVYDEEINNKSLDKYFSLLISERYKTNHKEVLLTPQLLIEEIPKIIQHYGQPNSAVISNWFISKEMGKKLKVALSGDGADELFGSYFLHRISGALKDYQNTKNPETLKGLPQNEATFIQENIDKSFSHIIDRFSVFFDSDLQLLLKPKYYEKGTILRMIQRQESEVMSKDPLDRMLEYDCKNLLNDQILNYSDILSMAHSLEVRTPFLDHRLVDYAFSLDSSYKIRNGETKYILKQIAKSYLPNELIYRKKEGFVEPAIHWLANELKDFCLSYLLSSEFNKFDFLNIEHVRFLLENFYKNHDFFLGKKVWNLLIYAIWERNYGN